MSKLIVDTRWQGKHGIGRCAYEIFRRLNLPSNSILNTRKSISLFSIRDLLYLTYLLRNKNVKGYYSFGANVPLFNHSNKPTIITIHDLIPITSKYETSFFKKIYFEKILKPFIQKNNVRIITVSNFSKKQIIKWANIDRQKVTVAYNGISANFNYDSSVIKQKFFLYVGNKRQHKNIEIIFKAFKKFKYNDQYKLVFSGEFNEKLSNYANKYNVSSKIGVIGAEVDDDILANYYRSAIATILPSFEEGFGLPIVESMACGTPFIASNIEVLKEVGEDGGLYFNPNDAAELSNKMQILVEDNILYEDKVSKSLKRAKDFNWDNTALTVKQELIKLNLYEKIK